MHLYALLLYFIDKETDLQGLRKDGRFSRYLGSKESTCQAGEECSIPVSGRKWQPTPVFLPGKSHRQKRQATVHLVVKELDTIETLNNNNKCY